MSRCKIAITGAHGLLGQEVVRWVKRNGHSTVLIDHTDTASNSSDSQTHIVDIANDYDGTIKAFTGCDAVIYLAAFPSRATPSRATPSGATVSGTTPSGTTPSGTTPSGTTPSGATPSGATPSKASTSPSGKRGSVVHMNNVQAAFNCFRACGELGIKRVCYAASFNSTGTAYTNQFKHFPIDEEYPINPVNSYSLAQLEIEVQANAFVTWYSETTIACLRVHCLGSKNDAKKSHLNKWERSGVMDLWSWAHPRAVARACLSSLEQTGKLWAGCEIFNIAAPETTEERPSRELAEKFYPEVEVRDNLFGRQSFWVTKKAERKLRWIHFET